MEKRHVKKDRTANTGRIFLACVRWLSVIFRRVFFFLSRTPHRAKTTFSRSRMLMVSYDMLDLR